LTAARCGRISNPPQVSNLPHTPNNCKRRQSKLSSLLLEQLTLAESEAAADQEQSRVAGETACPTTPRFHAKM
jgi:hypothetical protein